MLMGGAMFALLTKLLLVARKVFSFESAAAEHRSADLRLAVLLFPFNSECDHRAQAGDRDPVASAELSGLLALEIPLV